MNLYGVVGLGGLGVFVTDDTINHGQLLDRFGQLLFGREFDDGVFIERRGRLAFGGIGRANRACGNEHRRRRQRHCCR